MSSHQHINTIICSLIILVVHIATMFIDELVTACRLISNTTDIFFFVHHLLPKISLNGTTPEHLLKCLTTSVNVNYNVFFMFVKFSTFSAAKMFDIRVSQPMLFQFTFCIETLWTFAANIRLHIFMTK